MEQHKYWRSRIPVWLVVLFLLNVMLVMAVELLLFYRYPAELTPQSLAAVDTAFENCTIITHDEVGGFRCSLMKNQAGDYTVVPSQRHAIVGSRAKILKNQIQPVPTAEEETMLSIRRGVHTATVVVTPEPREYDVESHEMYLYFQYSGNSGISAVTTIYLALAALLEALELAIWQLIKGH